MIRIAVLTDAHANLPALRAALGAIHRLGVDAIYHTGDAIGIGPYPAETLDLLLATPQVHLVMGNHDQWFAQGLPDSRPEWMSAGEVAHQQWVHASLDPALREVVAAWPYFIEETFDGVRVAFTHYGLDESGTNWAPIIPTPMADDLDRVFARHAVDLVFYGHHHPASDVQGRARYINPGALGCYNQPLARFVVLETEGGAYRLTTHAVPYDDADLFRAFEQRAVPDRQLIYRAFFGSRFVIPDALY